MKTTGINSSEQISNFKTNDKQAKAELNLKSMMISCYVYGGIEKTSYNYSRYILPYREQLDEKTFEEVYKEQKNFLQQFKVVSNVYTDADGLNYNSLTTK